MRNVDVKLPIDELRRRQRLQQRKASSGHASCRILRGTENKQTAPNNISSSFMVLSLASSQAKTYRIPAKHLTLECIVR